MEKIVLFHSTQGEAIRKLASPLKIKVTEAEPKDYNHTLECICGMKAKPIMVAAFTGKVPQESLMLFCNLTEKHLDKILAGMKQNQIPMDFKAVLTPTNAKWQVLPLYLELQKEKMMYTKRD